MKDGLLSKLKTYWEILAGALLAFVLVGTHVYATWTWPLPRLVFREGSLTFFDRGGAQAFTHLDRLATYGAMKACQDGFFGCLPQVLQTADRHHPPVTALSAALWNHIAGLGISETLLVNLFWLALLLASVHAMARRMSGPVGGWIATLLAASAPVILGPSRLLHQDLPMTALLALFGALIFALGATAKIRYIPLVAAAGALAVLTKWEMIFGIGSAGLAGGIYALTQPKRYITIPALVLAAGLLFLGLHTYAKEIPSYSLTERSQLRLIAKPQYTWYYIRMALGTPEDDAPHPSTEIQGTIPERILFYLEATPASAAGALPTLFMVIGLGLMVWRRRWHSLAFGGSWIIISLGLLGAFVTSFGDDRFVHFFILPLAALGGAGLGRTKLAPLFAGLVSLTFLLHLWDLTLQPSPLPLSPSLTLPLPGDYLENPRMLSLRPDVPYGHGTWVRPETRTFVDTAAIQRVLSMAREQGARRIVLAPDSIGTAEANYLWVVESLLSEGSPPIGLNATSIARGVGYEANCQGITTGQLSQEFKAGTWIALDDPSPGQPPDLSALPWARLTCGYISDPSEYGLKARTVTQVVTSNDSMLLIELLEN